MTTTIQETTATPSLSALRSYYGFVDTEEGAPAAPWLAEGWEWSTNGHLIVAQRVTSQKEWLPKKLEKARRYLVDALVVVLEGSLASLRAFAGDVFAPSEEDCDHCDGTGYDTYRDEVVCEHCHETTRVQCERCDGDGKVTASLPRRYGIVAGLPVSLPSLAYALAIVEPCDTVRVGYLATDATKQHRALVIDGGGWRVVLMQVDAPDLKCESWEPTR